MNKKITIQPKLKLSDLFIRISDGEYKFSDYIFKSGRYSLFCILKTILRSKNIKKIYVPNFICDEVIQGIGSFNLEIIYYDIREDFSLDTISLKKTLCSKSLLVVVNYFGIRSNWEEINEMKNELDITVIEDNCHSLTNYKNYKLGINGDLSFNSIRKIIPVLSGSELLVMNKKYLVDYTYQKRLPTLNETIYYFRRYLYFLNAFKNNIRVENKYHKINKISHADILSYRAIKMNKYPMRHIQQRRLANFRFWHSYLSDKKLSFFEFNEKVQDEFLPYAFPCYANNRDTANKWIKWGSQNNISIIKWPKFPSGINQKTMKSCFKNVLLFPVNHQFEIIKILNYNKIELDKT